MKKIILTTVIAFFALTTTHAQGIDFGVKLGANFSTLSDAAGAKNKTGFHGGVFLGLKFSDKFALQPELLYSQQGAKFDPGNVDLSYANVPVVVKYYIFKGLNLQVGPQFGFVVDDNFEETFGEGVDPEGFDISGLAGVGLDLPLGIRIDARYNFGLTEVVKDVDGKNGVFSIALGYSFL